MTTPIRTTLSFVHIAIREGDADVLPQLRAFKEFQKGLGDRLDGPPIAGCCPRPETPTDSFRD